MDELLALMDNDVPTEDTGNSSGAETEGDEMQAQERIVVAAAPSARSTRRPTHPDLNRSRAHSASAMEPQDRIEIGIDNKLGIRMLKRQMSSIDLMDLISSNPFHSPASIAAMSLASLNRLLVEPTSVLSAATVCGKTNICTVGVVFSNSGTRISSNGRAFSILTIGNLQTGPVASVFMFGEAYSKLCTKCPPGTVVALVSPSLMSPKEQSHRDDTAVSFSVANPRQLLPVAQARDYGVCKGTLSTKRSDGKWISNGGQCKQHVDVRVSQYCEKHRSQRNMQNGATIKNNGQTTFMQEQKAQLALSKHNGNSMTMQMPAGRTVVTAHQPPEPLSIMDELESFKSATGRFQNAPMHMKKKQTSAISLQTSRSGTNNRPPSQGRARTANTSTDAISWSRPNSADGSVPVQGDWLNPTKNQSSATKKTPLTGTKRKICRDSGEYDGSVAIPKANKRFRGKAPVLLQKRVAPNQGTLTESKVDSIREQQRLLAQRQKENSSHQQGRFRKLVAGRGPRGRLSADDALKDSLFGKFSSVDTQDMVNAKSRFEDEAKAEEYAKSRRVVSELERQEEHKLKSNKQQSDKESAIQKEWVCATCKRTTKFFPKICKRANHKISQKRSIKKADTAQERRLKLDGQSAEDGGLKLGAGLEWDRRRFS